MQLYPVKTHVVKLGDNLTETILEFLREQQLELENNDVLALTSKIVSYSQGRVARLSEVRHSAARARVLNRFDTIIEDGDEIAFVSVVHGG